MNNEWQYHLVKGISWLVCRLPYKLILLIGACLGPVYGLIAKKQKPVSYTHLDVYKRQEQGTHQELLAIDGGLYNHLYSVQFSNKG